MSTLTNILLVILSCFLPTLANAASRKNPNNIVMNTIDSCWRTKTNWNSNRQSLADCAIGFGKNATGGKLGKIYEVNDPSDDSMNPKPGTLRYGAIQTEPLWIIFTNDMVIKLKNEVMVNSYQTIDGRGSKVEIGNGACITLYHVSNVIVHGIGFQNCKPSMVARVRNTPQHLENRGRSDGDAISIFASSNILIDHCFLANATDGLIDVIHASTHITISNNYFTQHQKVMLLGHSDDFSDDTKMKVTVAFNHFASGLKEIMPRVRFGYAHVVNNLYDEWIMYAIGGSANATIFSEGNNYTASKNCDAKNVTKRETKGNWNHIWNWKSDGDLFLNGARFEESGHGNYICSNIFTCSKVCGCPSLYGSYINSQCRASGVCSRQSMLIYLNICISFGITSFLMILSAAPQNLVSDMHVQNGKNNSIHHSFS